MQVLFRDLHYAKHAVQTHKIAQAVVGEINNFIPLKYVEIGHLAGEGDKQLYGYIVKAPEAGPKQHKCTLCGKTGTDRSNLRKHIENIHFNGAFAYTCKYCSETFSSRNKLNHHISGVHKNQF